MRVLWLSAFFSTNNLKNKFMKTDFEKMTKQEAIDYCHKNEKPYKAEMYSCGENGTRLFDCLLEIIESGTIAPKELPSYGMDFD